ncbi:MAG: hypothetical protein ACT4QC_23225 [Planctomycetaceae bacterium]
MNTPYEDLEFLAEYLPDEGESVVVTRKDGELVCQSVAAPSGPAGISDAELYGRLVLANERLAALALVPVWSCLLGALAIAGAFFRFSGLGLEAWYVALGLAALASLIGSSWMAIRRRNLYRREVHPMLESQLRRRGASRFLLVGAIRQHPELACLLSEVVRATDVRCAPGP